MIVGKRANAIHEKKHTRFAAGAPLLLVLSVTALIAAAWVMGACSADKAEPGLPDAATPGAPDTPTQYRKITAAEAKEKIDDGDVMILDVRTEAEYKEGHIAGSILLPGSEIAEKAADLLPDKEQTILVYCRSGARSARASNVLAGLGYSTVYDFGGIIDWPYEIVID